MISRHDFVYVYDGNSIRSPLLAKLSGSLIGGTFTSSEGISDFNGHGNVISSTNIMFINFVSDTNITRPGFKIQFKTTGKYPSIIFQNFIT